MSEPPPEFWAGLAAAVLAGTPCSWRDGATYRELSDGPLVITLQTPDPCRDHLELRLAGEIVGRFDFRRPAGDPSAPATTDTWHFDKGHRQEIGSRLIAIAKRKGLWGDGSRKAGSITRDGNGWPA